jgi:hypothetical protein
LSDSFPIQNGLKQGDALSPLLFNFALEYAIKKVQENQVRLKLNGTHQLLAYADDVNLLGDNIDTRNKNTETIIDATKEVGLEVNIEKTQYMLVSWNQNAGQNQEIKIGNGSFENVSQFNVYRLLVGKPEEKRPLGRLRYRWIDNIKMDLLEIGLSVVDWIGLAQDRYRWRALVNAVMHLRVP